jgi:hypothetical protein
MRGDELKEEGRSFTCVRGGMALVQSTAKGLYETFISRAIPFKGPVKSDRESFWGGEWFCPACGIQMEVVPWTKGMRCPQCGGNLGPFIYWLIEAHYHKLEVQPRA